MQQFYFEMSIFTGGKISLCIYLNLHLKFQKLNLKCRKEYFIFQNPLEVHKGKNQKVISMTQLQSCFSLYQYLFLQPKLNGLQQEFPKNSQCLEKICSPELHLGELLCDPYYLFSLCKNLRLILFYHILLVQCKIQNLIIYCFFFSIFI